MFSQKNDLTCDIGRINGKKSGTARLDPRAVLKSEGAVIAFSSESNSFFPFSTRFLTAEHCFSYNVPRAGSPRQEGRVISYTIPEYFRNATIKSTAGLSSG